jgi:hypothetical protein
MPRARLALALAASLALAACGGDKDEEPAAPAGPTSPAARSPLAPMTVSHVLIAMASPAMPTATLSKENAYKLAKDVIAQAKAGTSWQELVDKYSEDKSPTGKANSMNFVDRSDTTPLPPGTYVINEQTSFVPEFMAAVKTLKVGEFTQEPVGTQFGYHVIKRVK